MNKILFFFSEQTTFTFTGKSMLILKYKNTPAAKEALTGI